MWERGACVRCRGPMPPYPGALSRFGNQEVCSACGQIEAMEQWSVGVTDMNYIADPDSTVIAARYVGGPAHGRIEAWPCRDIRERVRVQVLASPDVRWTASIDISPANLEVNTASYDLTYPYTSSAATIYPRVASYEWTGSTTDTIWADWHADTHRWHQTNYQLIPRPILDTGTAASNFTVQWQDDLYNIAPGELIRMTPEEADARLQETRRLQLSRARRRHRAHQRGRRLLLDVLTAEQMREYAASRSFTVVGADDRIYRVRKGGTTHEMDPATGQATHSHCIHLPSSYVEEDSMIAVKLMLETDPAEFRRIANTSELRQRQPITFTETPVDTEQLTAILDTFARAA